MDIDKLEGELWATQAAVRALIKLHRDINRAALAVQKEIDTVITYALPTDMPEKFLEGIHAAKEKLLPSAADYGQPGRR